MTVQRVGLWLEVYGQRSPSVTWPLMCWAAGGLAAAGTMDTFSQRETDARWKGHKDDDAPGQGLLGFQSDPGISSIRAAVLAPQEAADPAPLWQEGD